MTASPQVVPFEGAQVGLIEHGALAFQQLEHACWLALPPRLLRQVDLRGVKMPPGDQLLLFGPSRLALGDRLLLLRSSALLRARSSCSLAFPRAVISFCSACSLARNASDFLSLSAATHTLLSDRITIARTIAVITVAASVSPALFRRANLRSRYPSTAGTPAPAHRRDSAAVGCQAVGRLVAAAAVLLQRLHHDPVQLAAHQPAQLPRLDVPVRRDRGQLFGRATAACSASAAPPRGSSAAFRGTPPACSRLRSSGVVPVSSS